MSLLLLFRSSGAATQNISPPLLVNASSLFAPGITAGAVTLSPPLLTNASVLFAPMVSVSATVLSPPLLLNPSALFSPTVTTGSVTLSPPRLLNSSTLFAPLVTPGQVALSPPLLTNASSFFAPVVAPGQITLSPPLLSAASSLFEPTVSAEAVYAISAARAKLLQQLAMLHGLDAGNPLVVSPAARVSGGLQQVVSGSATVTISTTATPAFSGSLDDWIDGLAALHGLTAPLVVTAMGRTAGTVSQVFSTSGTQTTVARQ